MDKKKMVFGVLSTALFFPFSPSEASSKIVDPLNPSIYVQPINEDSQDNTTSREGHRKKQGNDTPVVKKVGAEKTAPTEQSNIKDRKPKNSRTPKRINKKRKKYHLINIFFPTILIIQKNKMFSQRVMILKLKHFWLMS